MKSILTFAESSKYSLAPGGKFLGDIKTKQIELLISYGEVDYLKTCRVEL